MLSHDADRTAKEEVAAGLTDLWDNLATEARVSFEREGMDLSEVDYRRIAFVRYGGQLDEVEVPFEDEWHGSSEDIDHLLDNFELRYTKMYASAAKYPKAGYAIFQVALVASIETRKPEFPVLPMQGPTPPEKSFKGERDVYFERTWQPAKIYDMDSMEPGNIIPGLAILEHPATTLLVPPTRKARMDERRFVWLENT